MIKQIIAVCLLFLALSSCLNTKKYRDDMQLFQKGLDSIGAYKYVEITIKPGDNLVIRVYTQATNNQEQVSVLNMGGSVSGSNAGNSNGNSNGSSNGSSIGGRGTDATYLVNLKGEIDLPKIGLQKVEGLTIKQVKSLLTDKWSPYVKDIGVIVRLEEFTVNMIGEFRLPGVKRFNKEQVTLIDAISQAGGFTDDGLRNDVLVIREEKGERKVYKVDFRDAKLYNSPIYQLQQNDLIVTGMADFKFEQRASQSFIQKLGPALTVIGLLNFILGITLLIITINK